MTKGLLLSLKDCRSIDAVRNARGKMLAIAMVAISFLTSYAQVSGYTFQQTNGTYSPLSENATVVAQASSTTTHDGGNFNVNLPFSFSFNGEAFNQVNVHANGYATFGAVTPGPHQNNPLTMTVGFRGAITAFGADLRASTTTEHMGQILAESREIDGINALIIEYKNWSNATSYSDANHSVLNFQIQLFEDGKIQIVYGDFTKEGTYATAARVQVGLRGSTTSDFISRTNSETTPFTASIAATNINDDQRFSFATGSAQGLPTNGLTYTFTPPTCLAPLTVSVTNITTNSCTINASSVSSPTFEYEIRSAGQPGSGPTGLVSAGDNFMMPITISTLPHSSALTVYVRAMCMEGNSAWTSAQFVTPCGVSELPFIEAITATTIPNCWTSTVVSGPTSSYLSYVTTSTGPVVSNTPDSGPFVAYNSFTAANTHAERLMTPTMSTTGVTGVMVSYDFYHSTEGGATSRDSLILQYTTDNTTWIRVAGDVRRATTSGWNRKNYILPADVVNHPNFKVGFLFKSGNGYRMYLNNIEITQAPAPSYTSVENFVACSQAAVEATIIGANLSNATVTIEGVPATIVANTFNEIRFLAPAGTYGNPIITTSTGSVTVTELVDIMTPPVLELTNATETLCTGTASTVTIASEVSNFTSYSWSTPANTTVTGTAEEGFNIISATNNAFVLTATVDMDGRTCIAKDTFNYVAIANPVVYPNFTTLTLCEEEVQKVAFTSYQVYQPTSATPTPFIYNFGGLKTQQLFLASELTQMGWTSGNPITSVSLDVLTARADSLRNYRIRMVNTSIESVTTSFVEELMEVYADGIVLTEGTNTFNFSTPFNWDGVSNVMIEFAFNNGDGGYTNFNLGENRVAVIPTSFNSSLSKPIDNNSTEFVYNLATATDVLQRRAAMTFGGTTPMTPISAFTIEWTGTDLFTDATATSAYTTENTETVYHLVGNAPQNITAQITSEQGCVTTVNYTINANPIYRETLTRETCAYYEHLGQILYTSGVYVDTLTSVTGCDSIITLNLTVATPSHYYVDVTTCEEYTLGTQILTETGVYVETFESILGCADSIVHVNFTKIDQVTAFITHQGNTLTAHPSGENILYQWENCGTGMAVPGANGREFTPLEFGTYRVRLVQGACIGTSMCVVYSTTGITVLDEMELAVYPNPSKDHVIITFSSEDPLKATLVDATGQVVYTTQVLSGDQIDIAHLAVGVYLLQVESAHTIQTVRVIKQ